MQLIIGLVLGLIFFIVSIYAYTLGLNHGKALSNGKVPEVKPYPQMYINPVKKYNDYVKAKEEKKQADIVAQGWENIFSYDGTPQKEVEE